MKSKQVVIFTSPKAGSGAAREQIPRLQSVLLESGFEANTTSDVEELQAICETERQQGRPQPFVVAAGGDGTLSLVATMTSPETPLVPMPMGTENLLARYLRQSNRAEDVMKTIQKGKPFQMDAGSANGRLFLIMMTAGFDAEVVRRVHLRRKGHIWRLSYILPMLQTIARYRFPRIRVSGHGDENSEIVNRRVGWAMAFNLPCYAAGLNIEPDAVGTDHRLNLITFAGRGVFTGLKYFAGITTGWHLSFTDVVRNRAAKIRIESDSRVAYELDGDYVGSLPLEIETLPQRVRLLVDGQRHEEIAAQPPRG